jgi:hypothetical protein
MVRLSFWSVKTKTKGTLPPFYSLPITVITYPLNILSFPCLPLATSTLALTIPCPCVGLSTHVIKSVLYLFFTTGHETAGHRVEAALRCQQNSRNGQQRRCFIKKKSTVKKIENILFDSRNAFVFDLPWRFSRLRISVWSLAETSFLEIAFFWY